MDQMLCKEFLISCGQFDQQGRTVKGPYRKRVWENYYEFGPVVQEEMHIFLINSSDWSSCYAEQNQ